MKNRLAALIFTTTLASASLSADAAGFRTLLLSNDSGKDLTVGLWYPSAGTPPTTPNTDFGLSVAIDAPVANPDGELILLSHGFGGWFGGHADMAIDLADQGFIVAAPSHAGNTWSDMSFTTAEWALERPKQISQVIDHLLSDNEFSVHIDPDKIGVYGFSAGGYTALGLIGAVPDLEAAHAHCQLQPDEVACSKGLVADMRQAGMQTLAADAWGADPRVKAAAIAAPGLGFSYTKDSLTNVSAAVQLWSANQDADVPTASNAASIAKRLPNKPDTHWINDANHFAFLVVPCRDEFKQHDPVEYEMVCSDADGFDRRAFHKKMHKDMARFFRTSFKADG